MGVRFSGRTAWEPGESAWAELVAAARAQRAVLDLASANPASCGLGMAPDLVLEALRSPEVLRYEPDPLGMRVAREAVQAYYREHGAQVSTEAICLTTSTSEAYSFLFRLLCDPGDEVLIARPSYPLFDLLARVDDVILREHALWQEPGRDGHWWIDFAAVEEAVTSRTRAMVVVHPNNPTGHYVSAEERTRLVQFCAERGLALIVDEVFLDYRVEGEPGAARTFAGEMGCLCFALSGLSKVCALPQMKASWVVASGPATEVCEAMRRLEIVADTFLSMNAPVQHALRMWIAAREGVQGAIRERLRNNLEILDARLQGSLGSRCEVQGGWTAVLRVPRFVGETPFSEAALAAGVLVQPGELYGLPEGRCVVSLLTEPAVWRDGLARLSL